MSNPFADLAIVDEDDEGYQKLDSKQGKKGFQNQKKNREQKPAPRRQQGSNSNEALPVKSRFQEHNDYNKTHSKGDVGAKRELGSGHYNDRRSGTGRVDKPRKEGGGRGNVGNMHDQQIKDKYQKEGQEQREEENAEEVKPEEPQGMTLQEYYENKGIDMNEIGPKKQPVKKAEISADWIKKEKLTVMETKEDKKHQERNKVQITKNELLPGANSSNDDGAQLLGFNSKPAKPQWRDDKAKEEKPQRDRVAKKKVVINDDDFPSL